MLRSYTLLFLDYHFVCRSLYVFHRKHVVALLAGIARHIVQRLALGQQHSRMSPSLSFDSSIFVFTKVMGQCSFVMSNT